MKKMFLEQNFPKVVHSGSPNLNEQWQKNSRINWLCCSDVFDPLPPPGRLCLRMRSFVWVPPQSRAKPTTHKKLRRAASVNTRCSMYVLLSFTSLCHEISIIQVYLGFILQRVVSAIFFVQLLFQLNAFCFKFLVVDPILFKHKCLDADLGLPAGILHLTYVPLLPENNCE